MKTVIFGTTNQGKLADVQNIAATYGFTVLGLGDLNIKAPHIAENGATFEVNARIKFKALRPLVPAEYVLVTEDYGLAIEALGGEPGVYSRRWNDERREMTDEELIHKTLHKLKGKINRRALNVSVIAAGGPRLPLTTFRGELWGEILETPDPDGVSPGLPFRALMYIPEAHKMLYQLHSVPLSQRPHLLTHRESALNDLFKELALNKE